LQALNPKITFFVSLLQRLEQDRFAENLVFSDEATFRVCGKVNRQNVRSWGTENPHATMEHVRNSPKINVFCAVSSHKVYGQFLFAEPSVTGINYLDILQLWQIPQLYDDSEDCFFQQDGAPSHFHFVVRAHLNANLPGRCIGRASHTDSPLLHWSPRLAGLTPLRFFHMGLHQGSCVRVPYAT
jgi:hypothetical protein